MSGFLANTLLAAFLAYLGDVMGQPLGLAAVVALGGRIFVNLSIIRRHWMEGREGHAKKRGRIKTSQHPITRDAGDVLLFRLCCWDGMRGAKEVARDCVVGLDIGTTKVCTVVAEIEEPGRIRIVGVGNALSNGIRKGVVIDIDSAAQAIMDSVEKARAMSGYEIHRVIVGVTGEHVASLNSRGVIAITHANREITTDDVERVQDQSRVIVLPPDREIIHAIPRSYSIDGQNGIRYPVGMSGTRLEVETHIVTGAVTFLQNVAKCVHKAGLTIEATVLEPIATAESVLLPDEKNLGVCIADIGGGTTDIAIFVDGDIYYSSAIPVGGNHVTHDISVGLRASFDESERVKREQAAATADIIDPDESV